MCLSFGKINMCYCCCSLCSAPRDDMLQMDLESSEELHKQAKTKKLRYSVDLLRFSRFQVTMQIYASIGSSAVLFLVQAFQAI